MQMANLQSGRDKRRINLPQIVIASQTLIYVLVALDVPIARQIVGFVYLTFLPGFLLLNILNVKKLDKAETFVFSLGLSIALLMFFGLLLNEIFPLIGVFKPLSTWPLMITINLALLLLCVIDYKSREGASFFIYINGNLSPSILLLILLPFLSILGVTLVNSSGNNFILLTLIVVIAGFFLVSVLSKRFISPRVYPLLLFFIAVSLLFYNSLMSKYILGTGDLPVEFYVFKLTENASRWNPNALFTDSVTLTMNAMLSVTILPAIFSSILNMEGTWIFKIIYPLIFSFVAVGLYQLYRKPTGRRIALLSTFFLLSNFAVYSELIGLARQIIAELFFVLLLILLTDKERFSSKTGILFIIFSAGLIVSHYAMSYLFLFYISLLWLFSFFSKTKNVTLIGVFSFFIMAISWYVYISRSAPFNAIIGTINHIKDNILTEFFNPATRGNVVIQELGMSSPLSIWHQISRFIHYATQFFIIIGVIKLTAQRKKMSFSQGYYLISLVNIVILLWGIIIPFFATAFNMSRIYHVSLLTLAPLCILGGEAFFSYLFKLKSIHWKSISLLIVLVPFFLFNTGFVYETVGVASTSIPLSGYRINTVTLYSYIFTDQEVSSARWLSLNMNVTSVVYSDLIAKELILTSYSQVSRDQIYVLYKTIRTNLGSYVYLRLANVADGVFVGITSELWNATDFSYLSNVQNEIYSNGGSIIYISFSQD